MYEEYFGLNRTPFRITPDTSLFYDGGHRGDILGALIYAIHRGEGIIKVVGEVGSGKTMLCRMLQLELPDHVEIIYIANPSVSPEDILFVIADELKFDISRDASKHEVVSRLHHYLLKKHAEGKQVVLFVEEAQGMPLDTLEEIRLLSNLETDQHKLLQIILFGQPELDQNLSQNSIRQLRERITHDFNLNPLTAAEIHKYLNFRMREVGYTGPELINENLAKKMAVHSQGLLRRINILADKMLLSAFADDTHTLTSKHLLEAVKDSGFSKIEVSETSNNRWWVILLFGLLMIVAVIFGLWQSQYLLGYQIGIKPSHWLGQGPDMNNQVKNSDQETGGPGQDQEIQAFAPTVVDEPVVQSETEVTNDMQKQQIQKVLATAVVVDNPEETIEKPVEVVEMMPASKKNQQSEAKLDKVNLNQPVELASSSKKSDKFEEWLKQKIEASKNWLENADKQGVSIQVMMRSKGAIEQFATYMQTEWPLDLDKTYLFEVEMKDKQIYRVFYDEYPTITSGQMKMRQLPESVKVNSPYLHSIYRMQQALL